MKIIIITAMVLAVSFVFGQGIGSAPTVTNVTMQQSGGVVTVTYDLSYTIRPANSFVTLIISGDGGTTFKIVPMQAYLSGAVGSGVEAGEGKEIIWHIHDQYLSEGGQGLIGDNYRARVIVRREGEDTTEGSSEFATIRSTADVNFNPGGFGYFTPAEDYSVSLSRFQIGRHEVTQAEWTAVMGGIYDPEWDYGDGPNHPAYNISWFDAVEYCNRRSIIEGLEPCYSYSTYGTNPDNWPSEWNLNDNNHTIVSCNWEANGYRLPTEMEREYAARGGALAAASETPSFNTTYAGTNDEGQLGDYAWYDVNSGGSTHPVGTKLPNELGLYDMSGNVLNWCWDIQDGELPTGSVTDPKGKDSGSHRVLRGGSWGSEANHCSVFDRVSSVATLRNQGVGFRVVRNIATVAKPTFNPPGGYYTTQQEVTISCITEGAVINYTTNGDDPTEDSEVYSVPINISSGTILKAKAFQYGWNNSQITEAVYTFDIIPPVKDETVVIDEKTSEYILDVQDELIIFTTDIDPSLYEEGKVLVSGPIYQAPYGFLIDLAPYGFLRKVTGSYEEDGNIIVLTTEGRLEDVFNELDLQISQNLRRTDVEYSIPLIDGIIFHEQTRNPYDFNYNIEHEIDLGHGVSIVIDGDLTLTMGYDLTVRICVIRGLHYIDSGFTVGQSSGLGLTINGGYSYEKVIPLYEKYFSPIVFVIGVVPIVIVPKAIIVLQINADGEAEVTTRITTTASVSSKLIYNQGVWSFSSGRNISFDYNLPSLSTSLEAFVGAGPRFEVNLYGVTGPYMEGIGYLNLEADLFAVPWWTLYAGFKVNAGVEFEALGYVENYDVPELIDYKTIIAQAAENTVATPTFHPTGGDYDEPQDVTISCTTEGAIIRYTTNDDDPTEHSRTYNNPINISINTTVKARGFKEGWNASQIATEVYSIDAEMVFVAGGTFNPTVNWYPSPINYIVTLSSFYIAKLEVTQSQWIAVMGDIYNPTWYWGAYGRGPNHPAYRISWFDAIEYCNRLSLIEGLTPAYSYGDSGTNPDEWPADWNETWEDGWRTNHESISCNWEADGYRLPTEMQREFAARGGIPAANADTFEDRWAGTNEGEELVNYAWYAGNSEGRTHPVGTKLPNELVLYDMTGNVEEWVWDIGDDYPTDGNNVIRVNDPTGATTGTFRVIRDGSFMDLFWNTAVDSRGNLRPQIRSSSVGFRVSRRAN